MTIETAQQLRVELATIRQLLEQIASEFERLNAMVQGETPELSDADFMAIVGLGNSGLTDVSENHDRYVGEAIALEHLS